MNPRELKARLYAAHIIELNEYLSIFPVEKASRKIVERELNEIILNNIPNLWSRQDYVQGFDCGSITLKYVNIFERTKIARYIYEGVVKPSYKKSNRSDANRSVHSRQIIGAAASSKHYSKISKSAGKRNQSCVDCPKD